MFKKSKVSYAVALAAASVGSPVVINAAELEEIVVTATRRAASTQDVAVSVQALGSKTLEDLNVSDFEDYVRYLPSATVGGRGPGQKEVFIRGVSLDQNGIIGAEFSPSPNVAFYLDEQPLTLGGRNLDVYVTDIERVEVLSGPQGTLFGASAQAGAFRIITNKPQLDEFSAGVEVDFSKTSGGDNSDSVEAFVNIPIIDDKLAARIAVYNDNQGGYIDNVPSTFTLDPTINPNPNSAFFNNGDLTQGIRSDFDNATYVEVNNNDFVEDNFNDTQYSGARLGIQWEINDNVSLLVQHTSQDLEADGVFDYDPTLGDLNVARFAEDSLQDNFDLTTWTLDARLGALDVVYTGGILDRDVEQNIDYINYNGGFVPYYACTYAGDASSYPVVAQRGLDSNVRNCVEANRRVFQDVTNERETHEIRFSTSEDNAVRLTAGLFYDDLDIALTSDFIYASYPLLGYSGNAANVDAYSNRPQGEVRPGVGFINDFLRSEEQTAVFGEVSFDINEQLSVTLGARYYDIDSTLVGSSGGPFPRTNSDGVGGVNLVNPLIDNDPTTGLDIGASLAEREIIEGRELTPLNESGTIGKVTVSYKLSDDILLFGTWSEGFRPPGLNRNGGQEATNPNNLPEFNGVTVANFYETDDVNNIEFGWKTTLAEGAIQFNGAIYHIQWDGIQIARLDSLNISNLTFVDNAGGAEITGIESNFLWAASDNLTLSTAVSYNDSKVSDVSGGIGFQIAGLGSQLPLSPELQISSVGRYDWLYNNSIDAYAQLAVQYGSSSYSSLVLDDRVVQDGYTSADFAIGADLERWGAELYVQNVTDERIQQHINNQDDQLRITTNRPRTIGVRVSYNF